MLKDVVKIFADILGELKGNIEWDERIRDDTDFIESWMDMWVQSSNSEKL